jgi:hypothetical protein
LTSLSAVSFSATITAGTNKCRHCCNRGDRIATYGRQNHLHRNRSLKCDW